MLSDNKLQILLNLVATATDEELIFINGYLNGIVQQRIKKAASAADVPVPTISKITILYGTETGNAKRLANQFANKAKQLQVQAKVIGMDQYRLTDLTKEKHVFAIVSTHGDGEPPVAAKKFYDHIHNNGFQLNQLQYSVLALGDTAYPLFCKTGEEVDEQLYKLGARRIVNLQKCDVDFEEDANRWFDEVLEKLQQPTSEAVIKVVPVISKKVGKQTYTGTVITKTNLNDRGSLKETWHIEFSAPGVQYLAGDSLGIVPSNPTVVVEEIIRIAKLDPSAEVTFKQETITVATLLKQKINLIYLTERLVQVYANGTGHTIPPGRKDLLDLVKQYPPVNPAQLVEVLLQFNAIAPRLYTIASAPSAYEDEVHILVVKDQYQVDGEVRFGLCSHFLSHVQVGQSYSFFIQPNKRFRLPASDKNIIMVGPGTGIAAFRSFIAEREATGATGKNWLFFGEQHFASDFLYQTELQQWHQTGALHQINVAFSRDQSHKIYVQHRMKEQAAALFEWLQNGASFYVCGRKYPMSNDVEHTLLQIIREQGSLDEAGAHAYLEQLEKEGRYEKDVY